MAHHTPVIRHQALYLPGEHVPYCAVGSDAWFAWLLTATAFRFISTQRRRIYHGHGPLIAPISLRLERRRHAVYWYAYRRAHGLLHKRYAGRSSHLTLDRLEEVAALLHDCW